MAPGRNLKPTKPAVQISDADRDRNLKRKILITDRDRGTMTFKKWREKGHHDLQEMAGKRRVLPGSSVQVH
jgi:hypothetical protein